jgi:hypothetical protein
MTIQWEDGTFASLEAGWNQPYAEAPVGFTQVYGDEDYGQIFPAFVIVRDGAAGSCATRRIGRRTICTLLRKLSIDRWRTSSRASRCSAARSRAPARG